MELDWTRPTLQFAGVTFDTKIAVEKHVRWILSQYGRMQALRGPDVDFVMDLLTKHPNSSVITGCGIKRICVQWLDNAGEQRRFVVVRTDSSIRDFTWRHAIYPRSALDNVRRVCRSLVREQILAFRDKAFSSDIVLTCPVSGSSIRRDSCDVEHVKPDTFVALVDGWLVSIGLAEDDIDIIPSPDYNTPDRFQDDALNENWREYHRLNARLRVVHPIANRSLLRRADGKPNA